MKLIVLLLLATLNAAAPTVGAGLRPARAAHTSAQPIRRGPPVGAGRMPQFPTDLDNYRCVQRQ